MNRIFLKTIKTNTPVIIVLIIIITSLTVSVINTVSINRTFTNLISKDVYNLGIAAEISMKTAESRTEINRYINKYEPSPYKIKDLLDKTLENIRNINYADMSQEIRDLVLQIENETFNIMDLTDNLEQVVRNRNSLKISELSSSLLMQSLMLFKLSEKLQKIINNYILTKQIDSKTSLINNNIFMSLTMSLLLIIILLLEISQNKILSNTVQLRTEELEKQVSALKETKETLQASEKKFENLYNNAPVSYFSINSDKGIIDVNNTWLNTLGYKKENVINYKLEKFVHEEDTDIYKKITDELLSPKRILNKEIRLVTSKGNNVNASITGCIDGKTKDFHCVFYDITEQKVLEEQLLHSEKMNAIGQLAGGIAHDFNNQLAGIMGYADLIKINTENSSSQKYAENILTITNRSAELVKQLLIFARKEQQEKKNLDIHSILTEVETIVRRSIDRKIILEINHNAEYSVISGDSGQIINVFLNLAINARDAMPDGGTIKITTESIYIDKNYSLNNSPIPAGHYIKTNIEDTGEGIPEHLKNNIFEPFFTTKATGKGTGMGLSIAYSTVKNHDGFIDIYNKKDSGAVFSIFLPLSFDKIDQKEQTKETTTLKNNNNNYSILIAEDEEILRNMVSETLTKEGYRIYTAEDGDQAINIYKDKWPKIDLVLLDLVMPKVSGVDAFTEMKSINPDVKVIVTTGYSFNNNIQDLISEGVKDIIMKPYKLSDLLNTVLKRLSN